MKNNKGMTLITVVMMIIVIAVIASISIISTRDLFPKAKENVKKQNQLAVEAVVSRYYAKMQTSGLFTPAVEDMPGIKNPAFTHTYVDSAGILKSEEENVGGDWYLLLQEHLEEMGITYAKQNYLVNYGRNIVIPVTGNEDIFAELAMYAVPGQDDNPENEYVENTSEIPSLDSETKQFSWHIYNKAQLEFLRDFVNNGNTLTSAQRTKLTEEGYNPDDVTMTEDTVVYLMANIDLGARPGPGSTEEEKWETVDNEEVKWTPIGPTNALAFIGTFEGNNYTISGVYVNQTAIYGGLFGNAHSIRNLTVKNSFIKGGSCTGGIVGALRGNETKIENCHNNNTAVFLKTESDYRLGGIVAQLSSNIMVVDCTNTGNVTCNGEYLNDGVFMSEVGGIVGFNNGGEIDNCINYGKIIGIGGKVGGIAGTNQREAESNNCTNYGEVKGAKGIVGGIVGQIGSISSVSDCSNYGKVTGVYDVGGVVGIIFGNVTRCSNHGEVLMAQGETELKGYSGGVVGIIGDNRNGVNYNIISCYNTGKITVNTNDTEAIGGIVGWVSATGAMGTISNNYSNGTIQINGTNVTKVGGAIGHCTTSGYTLANNYYEGSKANVTLNDLGEAKSSAEMKSQAFVNLLNTGLTPAVWEIRSGQNDGYPVLK